jgi:aldose 1-epimerase
MEVITTMEGLQIYASGGLGKRAGKAGAEYGRHHAICLETQRFPDSINHPNFPSVVVKAGETYRQTTIYRLK